jgi:hypothetical protein
VLVVQRAASLCSRHSLHTHTPQVILGDFDEAGRLDPAGASSAAYWSLLDRQLEAHATIKHVSEGAGGDWLS